MLAEDGIALTTPNATNNKSKNTPFYDGERPGLFDSAYLSGYGSQEGWTDSMIDAAGVRSDGTNTAF